MGLMSENIFLHVLRYRFLLLFNVFKLILNFNRIDKSIHLKKKQIKTLSLIKIS